MALILAPLGGEKRRDIKEEDGCRGQQEERIPAERTDEEVSEGGIIMAIAEKRLRVSERMDMGLALGRRRHHR